MNDPIGVSAMSRSHGIQNKLRFRKNEEEKVSEEDKGVMNLLDNAEALTPKPTKGS
jgi:hypothetical protein